MNHRTSRLNINCLLRLELQNQPNPPLRREHLLPTFSILHIRVLGLPNVMLHSTRAIPMLHLESGVSIWNSLELVRSGLGFMGERLIVIPFVEHRVKDSWK
jgi:hypothetical protein